MNPVLSPSELFAEDPVTFLKRHVVQPPPSVPLTGDGETGRVAHFYLVEDESAVVVNLENARVYVIKSCSEKQRGAFPAYWCPYGENKTCKVMLGNDARLMITPLMNGCSFGLGSYNNGGGRLVMHGNNVNAPEGLCGNYDLPTLQRFQAFTQKKAIARKFESENQALDRVLQPVHYRDPLRNGAMQGNCTLIGLHKPGSDWTFVGQVYSGGFPAVRYYHLGLRTVFEPK